MIDWDKLVVERAIWVKENFPDSPPTDSIIGVIEETGELAHAHLKKKQGIRVDEDHVANAKDAIGDLIIYLLGVMQEHNIRPTADYEPAGTLSKGTDAEHTLFLLSYWVGKLAFTGGGGFVDRHQVDRIVYYARQYCVYHYWNFDDIVNETWEQVKKRNWVANPTDGS